MKSHLFVLLIITLVLSSSSCRKKNAEPAVNIIFLHHSTGEHIWKGKPPSIFIRAIRRIDMPLADRISKKGLLPDLFKAYNKENGTNNLIREMEFPKLKPYGWSNNPYDYYNIWVKNAGEVPYKEEPTLEILTKEYDIIMFKHCFPVSNIKQDEAVPDINSTYHSVANYKLQYNALRDKLHEFPDTKFILWTGAALVKTHSTEDIALRAQAFFAWVKEEWDLPDDNIYLWDLYDLQTDGGLYVKVDYASASTDSHPNKEFSTYAANLLFNRMIDVVENNGINTLLTGESQ